LKILVVDLDGTLIPNVVDWERLRSSVRRLLGVSHELKPLATSLAALDVSSDLKNAAWDLVEREEVASIERIPLDEVQPSVEALKSARARGFSIVIATLRSRRSAELVVEKLGVKNLVLTIVTREYSCRRIEQLKYIVEQYRPDCAVFIGDTVHDEEASHALRIPFIRVLSFKELTRAVEQAITMCSLEASTSGSGEAVAELFEKY